MECEAFDQVRDSCGRIKAMIESISRDKVTAYTTNSAKFADLFATLKQKSKGLSSSPNVLVSGYATTVLNMKSALRKEEARLDNASEKMSRLLMAKTFSLMSMSTFSLYIKCITNIMRLQEKFLATFEARFIKILRPVKASFVLLEQVFATTTHPSLVIKKQLSKKTGLTIDQINNWFTVHRYRQRKKQQESIERQLLRFLEF